MIDKELWGTKSGQVRVSIAREDRVDVRLQQVRLCGRFRALNGLILRLLGLLLLSFNLLLLHGLTTLSGFKLSLRFHLCHLLLLRLGHDTLWHLVDVALGGLSVSGWGHCLADLAIRELLTLLESSEVLCSVLKDVLRLVAENLTREVMEQLWEIPRDRILLNVLACHT